MILAMCTNIKTLLKLQIVEDKTKSILCANRQGAKSISKDEGEDEGFTSLF